MRATSSKSTARTLCKEVQALQGGTGKHVDGSILEPLQARPFQALVHLSDPAPPDASAPAADAIADGSLRILPGFHGVAARYFHLAGVPAPAGGFTPLMQHAELSDEALWVPARCMPARWADLYARGRLPPAPSATQVRSIDGLVKRLRSLADELRDERTFGPSAPASAGDYTLWDPRLPHSTGESDSLSGGAAARQVLYCAFMLANGNEALAAEQRECRQSGRHMRWAPSAQRDNEMRAGYEPSHLSALGRQLYGYSNGPRLQARERGAATAEAEAQEAAAWAAAETTEAEAKAAAAKATKGGGGKNKSAPAPSAEAPLALAEAVAVEVPTMASVAAAAAAEEASAAETARKLLTDAHVAFFARYGYVVVEGALSRALAVRVAAQVRAYIRERHGLDVDSLPAPELRRSQKSAEDLSLEIGTQISEDLSLERLKRAFSPDGSGMLEIFWLSAMEEARQTPALIAITRRLYAHTWGAPNAPLWAKMAPSALFRMAKAPSRPRLLFYIDRTSLRLPRAALAPLLKSCPCARCTGDVLIDELHLQPLASACGAIGGGGSDKRKGRGGGGGSGGGKSGGGGGRGGVSAPTVDDQDVFQIEGIVGASKVHGVGWRYLVRWLGYPPSADSFVSKADLIPLDHEMRSRLAKCEAQAKAAPSLTWVDEAYSPFESVVRCQGDRGEAGSHAATKEEVKETGDALVGQRIKVHWPLDEAWYVAVVTGYSHETKQHEVRYVDDDVVEALDLDEEEWRLDGRGTSARGAAMATKEVAEAGSKGVTTTNKGSISGAHTASASTSRGDPSADELTADCPRKRLRSAEAMATPVKAPGDEETGATLESPAAQKPRHALGTALITTAMPSAEASQMSAVAGTAVAFPKREGPS